MHNFCIIYCKKSWCFHLLVKLREMNRLTCATATRLDDNSSRQCWLSNGLFTQAFYQLSSHFSKSCWPLSTRRERDIWPQGSLHCSLCSGSWTALDSGPLPGASRCLAAPLDSALPAAHAPPTETAADAFLGVKRDKRVRHWAKRQTPLGGREQRRGNESVLTRPSSYTPFYVNVLKIHQISWALTVNSNLSA